MAFDVQEAVAIRNINFSIIFDVGLTRSRTLVFRKAVRNANRSDIAATASSAQPQLYSGANVSFFTMLLQFRTAHSYIVCSIRLRRKAFRKTFLSKTFNTNLSTAVAERM